VTHPRAEFRAAARAALQVDARFAAFTMLSAWAQNIDSEDLPVMAVATPREDKTLTGHAEAQRVTSLVVVVKRLGDDDLEDILDDDSDAVEIAVLGALDGANQEAVLQSAETRLDGAGERRVGTLTMTFRITTWTVDPLT
jgi:hypothetical protein